VTYIGQQPSTTFDSGIQDRFTGLTTNTVTLTHDISAETDILVVWNNIVQDSSTYSVGGTGNKTLTLGGTLVSADVVTVYYTNKVMQSVNPTANSVGITELNLSDGSNGQAITTNGSGTLSFSDVSSTADGFFATSGLSSKDLGIGLHIKNGDTTQGTAQDDADSLVIENSAGGGMSLLNGHEDEATIAFGDKDDADIGYIKYHHNTNYMAFGANASEKMRITSDGRGLSQFTAKVWANLNGNSFGLRDSHNISSATDNGSGDYTFTFSNNMANTNYAVVSGVYNGTSHGDFQGIDFMVNSVGSVRIGTCFVVATNSGASAHNVLGCQIVIFGD